MAIYTNFFTGPTGAWYCPCAKSSKIIKHRQSFPNDEAAMKLIFMGLKNISRKWTMPIRDWGAALNQFRRFFLVTFSVVLHGARRLCAH
jgi:hypothetical protein